MPTRDVLLFLRSLAAMLSVLHLPSLLPQ